MPRLLEWHTWRNVTIYCTQRTTRFELASSKLTIEDVRTNVHKNLLSRSVQCPTALEDPTRSCSAHDVWLGWLKLVHNVALFTPVIPVTCHDHHHARRGRCEKLLVPAMYIYCMYVPRVLWAMCTFLIRLLGLPHFVLYVLAMCCSGKFCLRAIAR